MLPCYYPPSASECSANDDNSAVRSKFRRIIILMLISWSENNGEAPTKIHTPHECNLNITTVRQCGSENRLRKKITCTDTPISTVWGFVTECAARRKSANWWPKVFLQGGEVIGYKCLRWRCLTAPGTPQPVERPVPVRSTTIRNIWIRSTKMRTTSDYGSGTLAVCGAISPARNGAAVWSAWEMASEICGKCTWRSNREQVHTAGV